MVREETVARGMTDVYSCFGYKPSASLWKKWTNSSESCIELLSYCLWQFIKHKKMQ